MNTISKYENNYAVVSFTKVTYQILEKLYGTIVGGAASEDLWLLALFVCFSWISSYSSSAIDRRLGLSGSGKTSTLEGRRELTLREPT